MRVAVLGGGGFRVPLIHDALAATGLPVEEIALQDVDADRLDVISAVLRDERVRTTTDLDAALDGCSFVFSAVRVGGVAGRVHDERRALELGVLGQETVGAGGLAYAARAAPEMLRIAERIAERAPEAWLISMTNPAGIVTEISASVLGERAIGVCDSPTGLVRRACTALGLEPDQVTIDYLGINHLGWLRALTIDGIDRLPALLGDGKALAHIEEARLFGMDVVAALGALPNEYVYWYYAAHEALVGVQRAEQTRAERVRDQQANFYAGAAAEPERARELWHAANEERNRTYFAELRVDERDEADVAAGGYESIAAALASALSGHQPARLILNVHNGSTVPRLPADIVIEVPCTVDALGPRPHSVAAPTLHELGLMSTVRSCERSVVEAALSGSHAAALRAFATHPLVGSLTAARTFADFATGRSS